MHMLTEPLRLMSMRASLLIRCCWALYPCPVMELVTPLDNMAHTTGNSKLRAQASERSQLERYRYSKGE